MFLGENPNDPENIGELSEMDVMNVLRITKKEFNIDPDRIFLMGHSMGGGGTLYLGNKYSEIWAGLAPLSPALMRQTIDFNNSILEGMRGIPIYLVTGERDRLIPVRVIREWAGKMEKLKMDFKYEEIKGGNHFNSITKNPEMVERIFDFFDQKKRNTKGVELESPLRNFTNHSGQKIRARLLSVSEGQAYLMKEDKKRVTIPIDDFSEIDRKYIRDWIDE